MDCVGFALRRGGADPTPCWGHWRIRTAEGLSVGGVTVVLMAGGYTSHGALGVPIGEREREGASGPAVPAPAVPAQSLSAQSLPARSVPARRSPFVFVGPAALPGLVVEQRRAESGWQVLVALVDTNPMAGPGLRVTWFPAVEVRPASLPSSDAT